MGGRGEKLCVHPRSRGVTFYFGDGTSLYQKDPRKIMKTLMDKLATTTVGDGKSPNIYFVSKDAKVICMTTSYQLARKTWEDLPTNVETAMEDRKYGVIASNEPEEDGSKRLVRIADFRSFERFHPTLAKT